MAHQRPVPTMMGLLQSISTLHWALIIIACEYPDLPRASADKILSGNVPTISYLDLAHEGSSAVTETEKDSRHLRIHRP